MGLDTSHDCWHGGYGSFDRWRSAIASAAGFPPLCLMEGYCELSGSFSMEECEEFENDIPDNHRYGNHASAHARRIIFDLALSGYDLPIPWTPLNKDPLVKLLNHSDSDGRIPFEYCFPIAKRLREILPNMPKGEGGGHIGDWRKKTTQFIKGLMNAHKAGEDVIFS